MLQNWEKNPKIIGLQIGEVGSSKDTMELLYFIVEKVNPGIKNNNIINDGKEVPKVEIQSKQGKYEFNVAYDEDDELGSMN